MTKDLFLSIDFQKIISENSIKKSRMIVWKCHISANIDQKCAHDLDTMISKAKVKLIFNRLMNSVLIDALEKLEKSTFQKINL